MINLNTIKQTKNVKTLGEVVDFLDHLRKPVKESERKVGQYPYYGANGKQGMIDNFIFDEPLLLLAEDGGHFGNPDKTIAYIIEGKTWVNNHAHVLRPKKGTDINYLRRHLEYYDVRPFINGATRGKLTKTAASEIPIFFPKIDEQKRIAAILDKADALRQKRRESIRLLDEFLRSVFLDMFGDPVTNPKGWDKIKLGEVAIKITSGSTPLGGSKTYEKSGILFIRSQNVLMNELNLDDAVYISEKIHNRMKRTWVKNKDVLLNITGASIGRIAVFEGKDDSANVNQHVCIIRLNKEEVAPHFLSFFIAHPNYQRKILSKNAGATRQAFNYDQLKNFDIILPNLKKQKKFEKIVEQTKKTKEKFFISFNEIDKLFNSLIQRAFRGKL